MTNSFTLGKDGNFGNIDFNKLRSGITKKDLGIEGDTILATIFDSIDNADEGESKGNGKLERNELIAFINKIRELAGKDTTISESEAKNYELNGEKLGKNKEDLLTFISKLAELTKGIKNVSSNSEAETITYEDGHTEQIFKDGSKIITVKDGNKTTVTKKNSEEQTTEETVEEDGTTTKTEYEENSPNPKKQTITNKDSETVILFSDGKKTSQIVTDKQTGEVQEFEFDDKGEPVLKKSTKSGEETLYSGGVPHRKTTTTQTDEGTRVSRITYDGNNSTEEVSINETIRYQKKVIDGVEYEVHYDENGNTLGVIVQNGESIQAIAKKFGVTLEDLVRANANLLKGRRSFNVGAEIKIPRRMEADEYSKAQEGRLDKQGAIRQFNAEEARRKAEAARRKAEAERREAERQAKIGDVIAKGQNGYYITKTSDGNLHYWNPNKKEIKPEEFKKVCPSIYENVTQTQRGATRRTRKKYDTTKITKQSGDLASKIHGQISGASSNDNTINLLRGITPENAAFVVSEYQRKYNVSLAKDIDDEWGLDIDTVKIYVCKKLVEQAKSLGIKGIYYSSYMNIKNLNSLQNWIKVTSTAIITAMKNAKETYYATDAEEAQRERTRQVQRTARTEAEQIVNDLINETSGINDVDKIKNIIRRIDKPEEIAEVNRLLTLKGYPPTDKYSPIENYIYQEANNSMIHAYNSSDYLEQTVQGWINNGTLKGQAANEAQARMAARVLYDGGDGFGTDPDKIKKAVRMIKCPKPTGKRNVDNAQAREVYRLVNKMIKEHNTFYGLGSSCTDLLDYCRGELWESEVKYLNGILAETNAIQGREKSQAIFELTEEAVSGAGTDIEYLEQAIKGIDSPQDRRAVEVKFRAYCLKKGIKLQISGQAYLQAILYDECDTFMGISRDHKEIREFNEMLIEQGAYTEEEIIKIRAEQAALEILEGSFSDIKDAVEQIKDKKVLAKVEQLLKTKGYKSLDDFLSKKLNPTKSDLINAELASNNLLTNEKAAGVAYRLMKQSDFNYRAMGVKAIRNEVVAKMVDEYLKKDGSSLAKFMEQFNKDKAAYKSNADFWDGLGKFLIGFVAEDISDAYRKNTDISDNMYVKMQTSQPLTPKQKAEYQRTVKLMEQKLAQMQKDYDAALRKQGVVSDAVNRFCEHYGIGTTRENIQERIDHDTETVRLLKLAAEGILGKMVNGKAVAVSFEAVFAERNKGIKFDANKVDKVNQQAELLGAMDYAQTNIAICWQEIDNGLNSTDTKRLTIAILDTLEKLSTMTGRELSLAGYGYKVKDSIIYDSANNPVTLKKLRELASQLKQGLSDVSGDLFGKKIPLNTSSSKINEFLEDAYDSKKENFKKEFKDAFGQDTPDEIIDNYISTINTGSTIVNFVAIIGAAVAAPFTGGGSLAVFAGVAGTSLGLNALERSTDADGYTNSEWTADMEQALWDGALAAVGMKIGKYAEGFAQGTKVDSALLKNLLNKNTAMISKIIKNPKALQSAAKTITQIEANGYKITLQMAEKMSPKNAKIASKFITKPENYKTAMIWIARVEAAGIEVTSDTLQSFLQMYCQEGHFDEASFITGLIMSLGGNVLGHTVGAVSDLKGTKSIHDGVHASTDAELTTNHTHAHETDTHSPDLEGDHSTTTTSSANHLEYTEPSKPVTNALFARLPVSLERAGEQILDKIKNLKNLVDYREIKKTIEKLYKNYKEVKEQLLKWLDEKFTTIGKIIKHENYEISEYKYNDFEIEKIIYANDKKTFNNALKDIIPDDKIRTSALETTMNFGEEFKFLQGEKEITITYDGLSICVKEVDLNARAYAGDIIIVRDADLAGSVDNILETESFDRLRTINLFGEDITINKMETLPNGEKIIWSNDGVIKVDTNNHPIEFKPDGQDITLTFTYKSGSSEFPSKVVYRNSNDEVIKTMVVQDNKVIECNYQQGTKKISDLNSGTVYETSFLSLDEYTKVLNQDCYVNNMKSRISKATSIEELESLKKEFEKFKTEYHNTTDLSADFDRQAKNLSPLGTSANVPSIFEKSNAILHNARIEQFGTTGLPLLYNLSMVSNDLRKYINSLSPSEIFAIYKKFNIKFVDTPQGSVLADIPNLFADATTEAEKKVLEMLTKYTKQNSIIINPPNLKKELEDFINDVPEFMFMIGKPQNGSHFGSLDVHTLSVLDKALKYADDAHLSNEQKDILKMVVMLHDMGKQFKGAFVSDTGHAALSKQYAKNILDRFDYPQEVKDRILNLIDNHHWFKDYNNGTISADDVVAMFGNDLEIAKVFARADLESVNNTFHINKLGASSEADYNVKMKNKLDEIDAGNVIITPEVELEVIGIELPFGKNVKNTNYDGSYAEYILDVSKIDVVKIGNVNVDFNDPKLKQLMANLKDGESFAIGCTNPKTYYPDVKYQIGRHEDGVGSHHIVIKKKGSTYFIEFHGKSDVIKKDALLEYQQNMASKIEEKKIEIKDKAYKVETQTFKIKGQYVTFDVYYGSKDGGSNTGYYVVNRTTGELFYAKESSGSFQYKAEVAATKLYRAAGIDVPDVEIITLPNGQKGMISKYIPELRPLSEPNALAYDGFGMDVLLENWDAVGLSFDNTLITVDGSLVIKLDAGGSFNYKAQGGPKAFTAVPTELLTMLDPHINYTASQIYGKMSREDFIKSLEKAVNLSDVNINNILSECGCPQYAYTLKQRRAFLADLLDEMKKTPQLPGESSLTYMKKVTYSCIEKSIEKATTKMELDALYKALDSIDDNNIKAKLFKQIEDRVKALTSPSSTIKVINSVQLKADIEALSVIHHSDGSISINVTNKMKQEFTDKYGYAYTDEFVNRLKEPLTQEDLDNIALMMTKASEVTDISNIDIKNIVLVYNTIKHGQSGLFTPIEISKMTPQKWAVVMNTAKNPASAGQLAAVMSYKGDSGPINKALTKIKNGIPISEIDPDILAEIEKLQEYINRQVIQDHITVTRVEGYWGSGNKYGCLGSVEFNGTTLDAAMEEAELKGDAAIKALEDQINGSLTSYVAQNEKFTSTKATCTMKSDGINVDWTGPNTIQGSGKVVWQLDLQPGTKGAFIEGNNYKGSISSEAEILLQRDSYFEIKSIHWDKNIQRWIVKANVSEMPPLGI